MNVLQVLLIGSAVLAGLLFVTLGVLFFISRRSQKVMESLLQLMLEPGRAKIGDATRVLATMLADEIAKIEDSFKTMRDTLNSQIAAANELQHQLTVQNDNLVNMADDAVKKISTMSGRLDNTVLGLRNVVASSAWEEVGLTTDNFATIVSGLLDNITATAGQTTEQINTIQSRIDSWVQTSEKLSENLKAEFTSNDEQMKALTASSETMQQKLSEVASETAKGFESVRTAAADYETLLNKNNEVLNAHLTKMDNFTKQSQKQLRNQLNAMTNTANVVGSQIRLAESSLEKQNRKLKAAVDESMASATSTEDSVRKISTELSTLTGRFDTEIKEFATGVVTQLKAVSGVANVTLENTKTAATAFSDSVKAMATGVRETLIEMNTAHQQLSGQSASLIKMSSETTAQLQPLSELIEKYYAALPDLARDSVSTNENLTKIVSNLNEKIGLMKTTVAESTSAITDAAVKLDDLAGTSRQQMIDLMADYAKAVNTMQTLNKQMMVARATAPMEAMGATTTGGATPATFGHVSSSDFLKQSERMFAKLHEQSLDLTHAIGAEIPDVVWKKYHGGDTTIFSKWLAKMLNAADKKRIREMLKADKVFRNQAEQFVRAFDKVLAGAAQSDNPDKLSVTLLKTDLGQIYTSLKN